MEYEIIRYSFPLGHSHYPRPCVIIDRTTRDMLAISTKHYSKFNCFVLPQDHPDFAATNLDETSYVIGDTIAIAEPTATFRKIGLIKGELAKEFFKWIG
jgi:hypothetical protein